jgi:HEAT repeat protein
MSHLTLAAQGAICAGAALEVAAASTSSATSSIFDPEAFADDQSYYVFGGPPITEAGSLEPAFGFARLFAGRSQIRLSLSPQSADGDSSNPGAGIPPGGSGTGGGNGGGPKSKMAVILQNYDRRMLKAVKNLQDYYKRHAAIRTLSQMSTDYMAEHPEIIAKLRKPKQISYIIEALEVIGYNEEAGKLLEMIGEVGIPFIIPHLKEDMYYSDWGDRAVRVLAKIGKAALKAVTNAMRKDKNKYVRQGAAKVLGKIGDPSSADHLFATAELDESWEVRAEAVKALIRIPLGDDSAHLENYESIAGDPHRTVRAAAARLLATMSFPETTRLLHGLLHDKRADVRKSAFGACRKSAAQIELLAGDLKHEKKAVRGRAAAALAMMFVDAGEKHLFALIDALSNRDLVVRRAAAEKLYMFERRPALYALKRALRDRDRNVRLNAIASLARFEMDVSEAVPALERLAERDESDEVKRLAQWAIEEIGPPEIIDITRED